MPLKRERHGHVEILEIDRPEARNAIDPAITEEFDHAFDEIERDDEVRAAILTASGEKAFCAGVDLKFQAEHGVDAVISPKGGFAGIVQRSFPKPLIAAVNGHALGGGLELILACDLAIVAEHAELGVTEVTLGQLADGGSLIRLPNRIPFVWASELILCGSRISGRRARPRSGWSTRWFRPTACAPALSRSPSGSPPTRRRRCGSKSSSMAVALGHQKPRAGGDRPASTGS